MSAELALDLRLEGDRDLLFQAITNLLDNAIKYSKEEDVIEVHVTATDGEAAIEVRDRGRGLGGGSPGDMRKRFERGRNVDDVVGSGLGLAIAGEVAAVYGGALELVEREGGGACARFSMPC